MAARSYEPGDLFEEKFRIERKLGEGGFATVYAATDLGLQRSVAIKLLKPDTRRGYDEMTQARFRRELQVLSRLTDRHTVRLYDYGTTADGVLFAVFEHVPGRDLARILGEHGRLDERTAEHILRQLLSSLREAHAAKLLHRDIKPENVRVFEWEGDPWSVKLLDFGIARSFADGSPALTATGELVGTPRYMSPEQLLDRPLTPASDIYSLGIMTFEMLAGRDALPGGTWGAQLDRLRSGYQFAISDEDARGSLMAVVQRMTAREPARRLTTVSAVLAALDGHPVAPRSLPVAGDDSRSHWAAWLALSAACLLAVGAAIALLHEPDVHNVSPQPPPAGTRQFPTPVVATSNPDVADEPERLPPACRRPVEPGQDVLRWHAGLERIEVLGYIPTSYRPGHQHPVVVLFHHGRRETPETLLEETNLQELADREGVILIAPQGRLRDGPHVIHHPWRPDDLGLNDPIDAVVAILDTLDDGFCIDHDRVFAIGDTSGAEGVMRLECSGRFAAVAKTAYRPLRKDFHPCDGTPPPQLLISPTTAPRFPVQGSVLGERVNGCADGDMMSLDEHEGVQRERHGCDEDAVPTHGRPECSTWTCDATFTACRVEGGHHWPDYNGPIEQSCDVPPADFPYGEVIWAFFESVAAPPTDEPADADR